MKTLSIDGEKQTVVNLPPLITQSCQRRLGLYCSTYLGNDLYYLNQVVTVLISYLGKDWLRKEYPRYAQKEKEFDLLTKKLYEVKVWYDAIEDKKFEKKTAEVNIKKYFLRTASKVALMEKDLYDLFIFLIKRTSLQRVTIPSEAFKILEHTGFRKISMDKNKGPGMPSD